MDILLGLDLGTTNCKVLAMDRNGHIIASAAAPTPDLGPPTLPQASAEYDANVLWQLFAQLIQSLNLQISQSRNLANPQIPRKASNLLHDVVGVCVSSMGESGVLIDATGEPCAPVIAWHDLRTKASLAFWRERITPIDLYHQTGLSLDHIYSASKLIWHREHTSQAFQRATHWLGLADWLTFKLTGVRSTSLPMASRTMLFDPSTRAWSERMLALADIPAQLMPPLFASASVVGAVTSEAAMLTGLRAGIPVSAGGHDHICGAIAVGAIEPGIILDSAGTAEAFMATLNHSIAAKVQELPGLGCGCHTARDKYYLLGGILGGGTINWLSELLSGAADITNINTLMQQAEQSPLGANGVRFLPYLRGSGPPKRDPNAFGAWVGFRLSHQRGDMVRAAVEGLSFGFRKVVTLMQHLGEFRADALRATGGSTRNAFWQQVKADVIGLPIEIADEPEASAKGAALLAGVGAGVFCDVAEAAKVAYPAGTAKRYEPDAERHAQYSVIYEKWLSLQPTLETLAL